MDATAQLTKNIQEDHNSLIGLFKFAVSAIAMPDNAEPISAKLVKGPNRDAEILENVCVFLENSTSKASSAQIRSELQRAGVSLRHLLKRAAERFETPEGLALVQSKTELRGGTVVLRRGSLDTTSLANALYHLGTPAGEFALKAGYLLGEREDDELLKKWLGDESIETRWKANFRSSYDMTDATTLPQIYRFKAERQIGLVHNLAGAYYLIEIAGTPREPILIATYLIRNPNSANALGNLVGHGLANRILGILIEQGYLKQGEQFVDWTDKLKDEIGLGPGASPQHSSYLFFAKPERRTTGDIAGLTDFRTQDDAGQILCHINHRGPSDDVHQASRYNNLHALYHAMDRAVRS